MAVWILAVRFQNCEAPLGRPGDKRKLWYHSNHPDAAQTKISAHLRILKEGYGRTILANPVLAAFVTANTTAASEPNTEIASFSAAELLFTTRSISCIDQGVSSL